MRDGLIAAKFTIKFSSCSFAVADAEVAEMRLLPPGIRIPMQADSALNFETAVSRWLEGRQMPDYRERLDELLIQAYELEAYRMGRMYHMQHTAAALSYYVSGFDRYYLTPERTETVCYALETAHFPTLFLLPPCKEETAENIRRKKVLRDTPGIFAASPDYTVPSGFQSWWEWDGEKKYLVQKPDRKALEMYKKALSPRFSSMKETKAGLIRTDFSMLEGDVLWLSELVPYFKRGKGIWEQAKEFLQEYPGSSEALETLRECEREAAACGALVAWSEMGIACGEGNGKAVVIL